MTLFPPFRYRLLKLHILPMQQIFTNCLLWNLLDYYTSLLGKCKPGKRDPAILRRKWGKRSVVSSDFKHESFPDSNQEMRHGLGRKEFGSFFIFCFRAQNSPVVNVRYHSILHTFCFSCCSAIIFLSGSETVRVVFS